MISLERLKPSSLLYKNNRIILGTITQISPFAIISGQPVKDIREHMPYAARPEITPNKPI